MLRETDACAGSLAQSAESTIAVPSRLLFRLIDEALDPAVSTLAVLGGANRPAPRLQPDIGATVWGGTFAGLTLFDNRPFELVLLSHELEDATHESAWQWAKELDAVLPSRFDMLVLWQNRERLGKNRFKEAWYWCGEQPAGDPECAWCQGFDYGRQYWNPVSGHCRAVALRRLPIS